MHGKDIDMARRVAEKVARAGGSTYFVGGFVRDQLMGRENKDVDIEVHGVSPETLEGILDSLGERTQMGASFGILGLRHYDLDIAMPRQEKATGRGHKDFQVYVDPFIGPRNAALRRDFTINALMQDVLTGEILDFFGGQRDLEKRLIRHVNDETFQEDPLRVLRGAQFAARFDFQIAAETIALSQTMALDALSHERIMGELEKALLKAEKPSVFFWEMRKMKQLSFWFPEAERLIGVPQDALHHPEGDVWNHTMLTLDEAAALRNEAHKPLWFMLSALCHDFGKPDTTEIKPDGRIHAYRHESAGVKIAHRFLSRITTETELRRYVLNMVEMHMEPGKKIRDGSKRKSFMHMFDEARDPDDLLLLSRADHLARRDPENGEARQLLLDQYRETDEQLHALLEDYRALMAQPAVRGQDLIDAGIRPGPVFTEALAYAHKLRLAGIDRDSALQQTLGMLRKLENTEDDHND